MNPQVNRMLDKRKSSSPIERSTPVSYTPRKTINSAETQTLGGRKVVPVERISTSQNKVRPFAPSAGYKPIQKQDGQFNQTTHVNSSGQHIASSFPKSTLCTHAKRTHVAIQNSDSRAFTDQEDSQAVAQEDACFVYTKRDRSGAVGMGDDTTTRTLGDSSPSVNLGRGCRSFSDGAGSPVVIVGDFGLGIAKRERSPVIGIGEDCMVETHDPNGILVVRYFNKIDNRWDFAVGHVGDEVQMGIRYKVNNKGEFVSQGRHTDTDSERDSVSFGEAD